MAIRSHVQWRTLGALFVAAAVLASLTLAVPPADDETDRWIGVLAVVAGISGVGMVALSRQLSLRLLPASLVLANVLVSGAVWVSGDPATPYALFYLWAAVEAIYVLRRRTAVALIALTGVLYAAVLLALPAGDAVERWLLLVGAIGACAALAAVLRQRSDRVIEAMERATRHDTLTGLLNRAPFCATADKVLAAQRRDGASIAVFLVGLDGFRHVNDGLGHVAGDLVLEQSASRLRDTVAGASLLARFGGDEFVVLLECPSVTEDPSGVAASIANAFQAPYRIHGVNVHLSATVGIAIAPGHGSDSATLMQKADAAMLRAKALGIRYAIYRADEDDAALGRLGLAADLRDAVTAGQLDVAYQPIVDTRTGQVLTVEALARWQHPSRGMVPPDQFIALAEQVDLVVPLTRAILAKATRACAEWRAAGHAARVAVNLSVHVLRGTDFPAMVREQLDRTGLPASSRSSRSPRAHSPTTAVNLPTSWRRCERPVCVWRSTTSAPATQRCPT